MALASSFRKPIHNSRFTIHRGVTLLLAVSSCLTLLAFGGCKKSSSSKLATQPSASPPAKPIPSMPPLDVCALLIKDEIQAVQGSPITDTKSSDVPGGVFLVGQCYYAAAESSKSVSLAVTRSNPQLNKSVRDYWKETFGRFSSKENNEEAEKKREEAARGERRRGEEEEGRPPKKIEGVGEEAFWSGNRFGGALYALKKETIVRVSVGGPGNEEEKPR